MFNHNGWGGVTSDSYIYIGKILDVRVYIYMYYVMDIEHPLGNSLFYQNNASSFDWKCKLSGLQVHLSEI